MDNQNFIFLKDKSPEVYEVCCMVDAAYALSSENYRYPIVFSRMALEQSLKTKLKIKSNEKKKLYQIIDEYCEKSHIDKKDDFYNYCDYLREKGNDAIHGFSMDVKVANNVVKKLQYCVHEIFAKYDDCPEYEFIDGDENWLKQFNIEFPDFSKYADYIVKIEEYEEKIYYLEDSLSNLKDKLLTETDVKNLINDSNITTYDENEKQDILNKIEDLKRNIPDNLQEDIAQIKKLSDEISDYEEIRNTINNLDELNDNYSFIQKDLSHVKDELSDINDIRRQIAELNNLDLDLENISLLKNKILEIEHCLQENDYDQLNQKINELDNIKLDFEKLNDINNKVEDIQDNLALFTEVNLSPEQLAAVRSRAKKLIIKAGPGAGKTRVLVERVKFLVKERHVDPKSLLVITFTEKAAEELKNRLSAGSDLTFEQIDQMQIGTIHGFCRTFLRNYVSSGIEVIDDQDNEKKVLFIKNNLEKLNLHKYAYIPNNELKKVASKFDEYASFQIDTDELELYIKKKSFNKSNAKSNRKYRDFIDSKMPDKDSKFPLAIVSRDKFYREKWINHKRLAIARAYKIYLKLLDERKSYDFNLLQIKTRDKLKEMDRSKVVYKNILIDEFQDTDKIQFEIFELLANGSESVTYVGDINQSIYWWRGATPSNFEELISSGEFEVKELLTNYRSPKNIVEFNNNFMVAPMELRAFNQNYGDLFYLNSRDRGEQAKQIVNTIKYMKKENKIKNYSDVGLLFRSTTMYQIEALLSELKANKIKFNIQGAPDFEIYPEVECMILLLWYLSNEMPYQDVFKISEFAEGDLNDEMFNLDESTLEVLKSYSKSAYEFSTFDEEQLHDIGITNPRDLEFFTRLNNLKRHFHNTSPEDETRIDLLELYYELFDITSYIKNKFDEIGNREDIDSNVELLNLALISRKINDFMLTVDRFDIDNLFDFLYTFYKEYSSPSNSLDNEDCVQILTIHKSKGLEFPVVFVCSLMEMSFPKRKPFKPKIIDYPTPRKIKYKDIMERLQKQNKDPNTYFKGEFLKEYANEEQRILYVGLTRAQSTLIVSHILNKGKQECKEFTQMKKLGYGLQRISNENLSTLSTVKSKETENDELEFSFTSLENYAQCPQKYNLIHNYDFVSPQNIYMRIGSIIHAVLDKINRELIDNNEVSMEFIEKIIAEAIESNADLEDNEIFLETLNAVKNYYPQIGVEFSDEEQPESESSGGGSGNSGDDLFDDYIEEEDIIPATVKESEYPFTIPWYDGRLKGSIDLIMECEEESISLVDFKTSDEDSIGESYAKQLHFYYMAMDNNSKYGKNKEKTSLKLYSLKDNKFIQIEIDDDMIDELNQSLLDTSENVRNKQYCETSDDSVCDECLIRNLCCK